MPGITSTRESKVDLMRKIFAGATIALLAATIVPAQTKAKAAPTSAKAVSPDSVDSHEMNIRAYIELLRTDIRASRSQVMGAVMQLDTDQAAKFWPIFKEFETDYSVLGDQMATLVKKYVDNYSEMTDDVADQLAKQSLSIEQQRNELKKKYYDRMQGALGAITAARFLQVENQLERLMDLEIASKLPVVRDR